MNSNTNDRSKVIKNRAEALSSFRSAFAANPGSICAFERATGIPRSFVTEYLSGRRPGIRGKAKDWARRIQDEATRISRSGSAA